MKTNKILKTIFIITFLSISIYYGLTINNKDAPNIHEIKETSGNGFGQSLNIVLIIENERNGEVISRMEKNDDLALRNLAGLMHYIMKGSDVEPSTAYKLTDGSSFALDLDDSSSDYIMNLYTAMHIGTGITAADYEDYKLETSVYNDRIEALGYSVAGLQMNATFVTTFNIDNTHAITEAGFTFYTKNGGNNHCMLFRDVFSAINVISGDLLTVKYVIMFN